MIIYLYGPDTYRSKQKLHEMVEEFKRKRDPSGLNVTELDGGVMTLDDFRRAALTQSFLVNKRLVVVQELDKNKDQELAAAILGLLREKNFPHDDLVIIFWQGLKNTAARGRKPKTKAKSKAVDIGVDNLFGWLKEQKYVYEFKELTQSELESLVTGEVRKCGGTITSGALAKLLAFVGNDLWQITNEIAKLVAYRPAIDEKTVALLVHAKIDENIFGLMDAVSQRDKKGALRLYEEQLRAGLEPMYLHTMFVRQFRMLVQTQDFLSADAGGRPTSEGLAQALGFHPFVAKKVLAQARNFSEPETRGLYQELAEVEYQAKTSPTSVEALLTLFIVKAATRN